MARGQQCGLAAVSSHIHDLPSRDSCLWRLGKIVPMFLSLGKGKEVEEVLVPCV